MLVAWSEPGRAYLGSRARSLGGDLNSRILLSVSVPLGGSAFLPRPPLLLPCRISNLVSSDYRGLTGFHPGLGHCLSIWQSVSLSTGPPGTGQQKRPVWALPCPQARWPVCLSHYGLPRPQTPATHGWARILFGMEKPPRGPFHRPALFGERVWRTGQEARPCR